MFFIKTSICHLQKTHKQFLEETVLPQSKPLKHFVMGISQDVFQVMWRASQYEAFCGLIGDSLSVRGDGQTLHTRFSLRLKELLQVLETVVNSNIHYKWQRLKFVAS